MADFTMMPLVHETESRRGAAAVFGEPFADEVLLTLKTQSALPVRIAQP